MTVNFEKLELDLDDENDEPELSDEDLKNSEQGNPWCPEPEPFVNFIELENQQIGRAHV